MLRVDAPLPNGVHGLAALPAYPVRDLGNHAEGVPLPERLLWSLEEAAHALNVSGRTLKRMASGGELPAGCVVHLARRRLFARKAIEAWIQEGYPPVKGGKRAAR
jgi:excisionase family DNA binding protein